MSDFSIHPVYLSARAAIIAPERAIPVSLYFTQKGLPRLGPERWCLVVLLRSLCIDNKRRADGTKRVTVSWRELAEKLDVHEETVASWLKHEPIPNDKPWRRIIPSDDKAQSLALFIPRLRYAYETKNGKTRRTGFLLEVLMEDHVVPEDTARLRKQIEIMRMEQSELGLETYRLNDVVNSTQSDLPVTHHKQQNPDLHNMNRDSVELPQLANPSELDLHNYKVNRSNLDLPPSVKPEKSRSDSYVNLPFTELLDHKSEIHGKNVNELIQLIKEIKQKQIRKNIRREIFEPIITLTESLLEDSHSTAMLYKVLNALYPERLDLFLAAVHESLTAAETDPNVNRGAVFVRAIQDYTATAGIELGFGRVSTGSFEPQNSDGNPGSHPNFVSPSSIMPSTSEAIWAETQLALRRQMTQATYDAIVQGTRLLGHTDNRYIVGVHTETARQWLENRLRNIVERALSTVVGEVVQIDFVLTNSLI